MATAATAQRRWRAACPQCGAPVEFASAASPMAVCSYCRSTLARDGETLRRTGESAELFEDHSPLQIGSAGRWQGVPFAIVGRLQMRYADGTWNEWHALFDNGRSAWLSEDNGRYVIAFDLAAPASLPRLDELRPGASVAIDGRAWQVASVVQARVAAAEGELPGAPNLAAEAPIVDLREAGGAVGTLDFGDPAQVRWSVGHGVDLADLALTGLRETSEKTLPARGAECPSCGAALEIRLETTQSIVCHQCHAVVDVSKGVGGDLAHYAQTVPHETGRPRLPLGATATLALGGPPTAWQIVGYVEREDIDADHDGGGWREYLLYARAVGFVFLVDAEDGWSWSRPLTGAPTVLGNRATWNGTALRRRDTYTSRVRYVAGEFYWRLGRGELTRHADYAADRHRLNREQTANEVTWSFGDTLDDADVNRAFGLTAAPAAPRAAPAPVGKAGGSGLRTIVVIVIVIVLVMWLLSRCGSDRCDDIRNTFGAASTEYRQCLASSGSSSGSLRTGGGSYGGWGSAGGGHK